SYVGAPLAQAASDGTADVGRADIGRQLVRLTATDPRPDPRIDPATVQVHSTPTIAESPVLAAALRPDRLAPVVIASESTVTANQSGSLAQMAVRGVIGHGPAAIANPDA